MRRVEFKFPSKIFSLKIISVGHRAEQTGLTFAYHRRGMGLKPRVARAHGALVAKSPAAGRFLHFFFQKK